MHLPVLPAGLGDKPRLGYAGNALARLSERRMDAAFLAELEGDARTRCYAVGGELVVLKKATSAHDALFSMQEARGLGPTRETVFLGVQEDTACFGVGIEPAAAEALKARDDLLVIDLRSIAVQALVSPDHLAPLAEAKAMLLWHARHRFCANCGAPTRLVCGGWRRDCPQCKAEHFPRTDPVVIMLAVHGEHCLLGRQTRFVPGMWSCLAGFVEPGETIEEAVRRETLEEAGIRCGEVRYFRSQPWPFPMSLMIGCHAEARSRDITIDGEELEQARWFDRDEIVAMLTNSHPEALLIPPPMAIAHHIIRAWVEEGADILRRP